MTTAKKLWNDVYEWLFVHLNEYARISANDRGILPRVEKQDLLKDLKDAMKVDEL